MKLYECPFCHQKVITLWDKVTAGSLSSKGKACPKCKGRYVNDKLSLFFRIGISAAVLVYACIALFGEIGAPWSQYTSIGALFVISRLLIMGFDALFPDLTEALYK